MQPLLQIRALTKRFDALEVLKGVDLDVHEGQVVSVIGSSGSGKTTLLRCVNLLEEFDGGEILIDGEAIGYRVDGQRRRRLKDRELSRQRAMTGMVFQSFNLFPHLTALGNVALGLTKVKGMAKSEARALAAGLARPRRTGRACRALSEPAVGRPAAARSDRPRPGHEPEARPA